MFYAFQVQILKVKRAHIDRNFTRAILYNFGVTECERIDLFCAHVDLCNLLRPSKL